MDKIYFPVLSINLLSIAKELVFLVRKAIASEKKYAKTAFNMIQNNTSVSKHLTNQSTKIVATILIIQMESHQRIMTQENLI